jgi:hypothetical protein
MLLEQNCVVALKESEKNAQLKMLQRGQFFFNSIDEQIEMTIMIYSVFQY